MEIKLVVRETEDWRSVTYKNYINAIRNRTGCKIPNNIRMKNVIDNLNVWKTLNLSMFEYRYRLKNIATSNWPYSIEWVFLEDALANKSSNVIYIPMDDDDIIDHNIINKLYDIYKDDKIKAVVWKTWAYSVLNDRPTLFKLSNHASVVPPNCYSIRGDCITKDYLWKHYIFSPFFGSYHKINEEHAVYFNHPASTCKIQQKYIMDNIEPKDINVPFQLGWAKNFINDVNILTRKLYD